MDHLRTIDACDTWPQNQRKCTAFRELWFWKKKLFFKFWEFFEILAWWGIQMAAAINQRVGWIWGSSSDIGFNQKTFRRTFINLLLWLFHDNCHSVRKISFASNYCKENSLRITINRVENFDAHYSVIDLWKRGQKGRHLEFRGNVNCAASATASVFLSSRKLV